MYDFLDLKLIRYMNEELSLSAVALRARMSLPAVSQRLSKLEETVNTKLVFRSGRFGLTAAGKIFLKSANIIGAEVDLLEQHLRTETQERNSLLRIMCTDSLMIDDLPLVLDRLASDIPSIHFLLQEGSFTDIMRRIMSGEADIGLVAHVAPAQGLELIPYKTERLCLIVPPGHDLAQQQKPILFREAMHYDFIGTDESKRISSLIDAVSRSEGKEIHYRVRVNSFEAQAALVAKTQLGIALTLEAIARRHALSQPIKLVPLADEWASGTFFLCVRDLDSMSNAGRRLIDLLKMQFHTAPNRDK